MAKAFGVGESQTGNVWGLLYDVPSYRQLEYRLSTGRGGEGRDDAALYGILGEGLGDEM